ncbi:pyridoxal phosphate-dependent aminotransferase, partial [Bacillus cereus]
KLLGVSSGDTVFCSTLTFIASANPIIYQGAEPVFIDSEPETWNMSPTALEKAFKNEIRLGRLPKAVVVVHLFGQSAKMDEIITICNNYGVPIVEDSAESLGTIYKGKQTGSFGEFGIFSFNGNKTITTSGG